MSPPAIIARVTATTLPDGSQTTNHYGVFDGYSYVDTVDLNRHRKQVRSDSFGRMVQVYEFIGV